MTKDISFQIVDYDFNQRVLDDLRATHFANDLWPVVYIITDGKIKEAYVGETTDALSRMDVHLKTASKKKLSAVHIISSERFNKSATLDIESNLIRYMAGDGVYKLLNQNPGLANHNYYEKKDVYWNMFEDIWNRLQAEGIAKHSLTHINNSDLFKYSPYKSLSRDQRAGLKSILIALNSPHNRNIIVEGGAGTGKTILAIHLFKLLVAELDDFNFQEFESDEEEILKYVKVIRERKGEDLKMALVIPMSSFRETVKKIFSKVKGLSAKMVIGPAEVADGKFDILIVDESHRLRRRVNLGSYFASFDNACMKLGLDKHQTSEVEWVVRQSDKAIFFYDENQSIKPSDALPTDFLRLKSSNQTVVEKLRSQFRVLGGNGYVAFVEQLLSNSVPAGKGFFSAKGYEMELFESIEELVAAIQARDREHGLSRLIAGYSWPWVSKKSPDKADIKIEGMRLWWNRKHIDWINTPRSLEEVGCIHTTQGYDLNYAGIIFGHEISYDPKQNRIVVNPGNYHDKAGKATIRDVEELRSFILNIYQTIMLRGIRGTYVYACDPALRKYLKQHIYHKQPGKDIEPLPADKVQPFVNSIPLYNLKAAAGGFSPPQQVDDCQWIAPPDRYKPASDLFACQVVGESMNRVIPNGSVCLFRRDQGGSRNGKIVLVEMNDRVDMETGSRYTVKRYYSTKSENQDAWHHESIVLKAETKEEGFEDIVLVANGEASLRVIGMFEVVLGGESENSS
ncbi:MAG: DUF2075 domain-containing protein [Chitinophagaceae bacterium]|nr:MAG: DUF2075 domain-containing protein [Chitinophagaceae bacterium]